MPNRQASDADATITLTRATLNAINVGKTTFEKEAAAGTIRIAGNGQKVAELMGLMDSFDGRFNIVTP
jgi:alkyl sulfatase BDS1-like metallo-beta-lactamase superfamily hydrolase